MTSRACTCPPYPSPASLLRHDRDVIETWGETQSGEQVLRAKITGGDLTAHVLSFGAALQDLRLAGHDSSLVLGYPELTPYLSNPHYLGSIVGRYANRIKNGRTILGGREIQLDRNALGHHLHGGTNGTAHRNWRIMEHDESKVTLGDVLPDGHMGFPGRLSVWVTYEVTHAQQLRVSIRAQSDAETLCNFTSHNYYNLDGSADIRHHLLQLNADHYLASDATGIPLGGPVHVSGTRFDFRAPTPLGDGSNCLELDHNFCLHDARRTLTRIGMLRSQRSGLCAEFWSTEPGFQVYSGSGIKGDAMHNPFAGIALEPQIWPDSPNNPDFPSARLMPGEVYQNDFMLAFSHL